jgi:hypothetical protein
MGRFAASLKTIGDRQGMPATINVDGGRISIALGDHPIGDWSLDEVNLEPMETGFRMAAEGEQIILEMPDPQAFQSEVGQVTKRRKLSLPQKERVLAPVDKGIALAEKKWGSLLPEWVFTRIMFGIAFGALILMLVFPGLVSTFLLIVGLVVVILGAVIYTDPMLVAKWLPGRMSPVHVLLFGVAILMLGVLLGVVAK